MKIIHSFSNFSCPQKTIVTIGTFDGIHIGHQKILKKLVSRARKERKKSVLLTFFPHPRMVLQKDVSIKLLNTMDEKAQHLKNLGLDFLVIHPFDRDFSRMKAIDFVRNVLIEKLNTSSLVIGYDHHFGKNREGNIDQLREYSLLYDFEVEEIAAQDVDSVSVSSTKIREALKNGEIKTANAYLGYSFSITGEVVSGEKIGATLGFPTANISVKEEYKLIPRNGAYVVQSNINGANYYGMMNIGIRPTLDGKNKTIEVHFFDFEYNLYSKTITVEILYFLRPEQKFNSLDSLKKQLLLDREASMDFINANFN